MQAAEGAKRDQARQQRAPHGGEARTLPHPPPPQPWLQPLFLAALCRPTISYPRLQMVGAAGPGAQRPELLANSSALEEAIWGNSED